MSPRKKKKTGEELKQPASIPELARRLGVSIGTVDRALHNRPGINPATLIRVRNLAEKLGYRPNPAARYLVSKKRTRIGVNLPHEIAFFWDAVREGILDVARSFEASGVQVVYRSYPRLGQGEAAALEEALKDDLQGLVIAPGEAEPLASLLHDAPRKIPIVCVNTGSPEIDALTTVAVDSVTNGSLVAELMGRFVQSSGEIVVVTGQMSTSDHALKLEGFRNTLAALWPPLELAAIIEAHDDEREAYEKCREVLSTKKNVVGVYVSTANSVPVMRAIADLRLEHPPIAITTDLFPALAPLIESGAIAATVHQRPFVQGQMALRALCRSLIEGIEPPRTMRLAPHVVMRSNLRIFLEDDRSRSDRPGWSGAAE